MTTKRPALGKGLSALIGGGKPPQPASAAVKPKDEEKPGAGRRVLDVALDRIAPNRYQARRSFDTEGMDELAASIARTGIIQPLAVRAAGDGIGKYELIAGERRFRAAGMAGMKTVPVILMDASDMEM